MSEKEFVLKQKLIVKLSIPIGMEIKGNVKGAYTLSDVKTYSPTLGVSLYEGKQLNTSLSFDFAEFVHEQQKSIKKENSETLDLALHHTYTDMIDILQKELKVLEKRIEKNQSKPLVD
jgi:uncharacterized membrane protein YfbV (UPF0208 family)